MIPWDHLEHYFNKQEIQSNVQMSKIYVISRQAGNRTVDICTQAHMHFPSPIFQHCNPKRTQIVNNMKRRLIQISKPPISWNVFVEKTIMVLAPAQKPGSGSSSGSAISKSYCSILLRQLLKSSHINICFPALIFYLRKDFFVAVNCFPASIANQNQLCLYALRDFHQMICRFSKSSFVDF